MVLFCQNDGNAYEVCAYDALHRMPGTRVDAFGAERPVRAQWAAAPGVPIDKGHRNFGHLIFYFMSVDEFSNLEKKNSDVCVCA